MNTHPHSPIGRPAHGHHQVAETMRFAAVPPACAAWIVANLRDEHEVQQRRWRSMGGQATAVADSVAAGWAQLEASRQWYVERANGGAPSAPQDAQRTASVRPVYREPLTAHEAAQRLGCSREYVNRLLADGVIEGHQARTRGPWTVDGASVEAYLLSKEEPRAA